MDKRSGNIANVWEEEKKKWSLKVHADPGGVCIVFGVNGGDTRLAAMEVSTMGIRCGGTWASKSFLSGGEFVPEIARTKYAVVTGVGALGKRRLLDRENVGWISASSRD